MEITTVKLRRKTKNELDTMRANQESYDQLISRLIIHIKRKELKKELIEGYKKMNQKDIEILEEWEGATLELEQ